MKDFLTSTKGKIIAGCGTLAVIAAIVVIALSGGYRTIVVQDLNGVTSIINNGKSSEAYKGLHFKDGDDVTVSDTGDLTLAMDQDKYMYAEPSTHFWIEAAGKQGDTRTKVHMDRGSNLMRIDNKLTEKEAFDVETPNATMSVRGTVFRVTCDDNPDGYFYTKIEVLEGIVYVEPVMENGTRTGKSRLLNAGESVIIYSDPTISDFLTDESGEEVRIIDYKALPQQTAIVMGSFIDDGRQLSIGKELLFDYVEINDHIFDDAVVEAAVVSEGDCKTAGYTLQVCTVCGEYGGEKVLLPLGGHTLIEEDHPGPLCTDPGYVLHICEVCGEEVSREDYDSREHDFDETIIKEATIKAEGSMELKCKKCGYETTEKIAKLPDPCVAGHDFVAKGNPTTATCSVGSYQSYECSRCQTAKQELVANPLTHNYAKTNSSPADCYNGGYDTYKCSLCGVTKTESTGGALGHDMQVTSHSDASCTSDGSTIEECSRCGTTETSTSSAYGHNWNSIGGDGSIGSEQHQCSNCGSVEGCSIVFGDLFCGICGGRVTY